MKKNQAKPDYNQKNRKKHSGSTKDRSALWMWLVFFPLMTAVFSVPIWYYQTKWNNNEIAQHNVNIGQVNNIQQQSVNPPLVEEQAEPTSTSQPAIIFSTDKKPNDAAMSPTPSNEPSLEEILDLPPLQVSADHQDADASNVKDQVMQDPDSNDLEALPEVINTITPKSADPNSSEATTPQEVADSNKAEPESEGEREKVEISGDLTVNKQVVCRLPQEAHIDKTKAKKLPFKKWLAKFKTEAVGLGLNKAVLDDAFRGVHPIQKVIKLDRHQSEYSMTFSKYLRNSISSKRISTGRQMLKKHSKTLNKVEKHFGVQSQFLVAFWAMESNFGSNMGNFPTISTLATLAHEGRRSDFFHGELLCALQIIEDGHVSSKQMKSSWAGAMGQPQFMPSTFFHYGEDGNADGKLNIWKNTADVFASSANYLKQVGWKAKEPWGLEVKLPKGFDPYQAKFTEEKPVSEWQGIGVKQANGKKLNFGKNLKGSIILPSGIKGPAFLVFNNFRMIRKWNRSINYALAVGHLSDRLMGKRGLIVKGPKGEQALSRKNAMILQANLKKLGFYSDNVDGMVGLKTRDAIREYQSENNIPADAYPSPSLIKRTQKDVTLINVKNQSSGKLNIIPETSLH